MMLMLKTGEGQAELQQKVAKVLTRPPLSVMLRHADTAAEAWHITNNAVITIAGQIFGKAYRSDLTKEVSEKRSKY